MEVTVRRARPADVRGIRRLIDIYAAERRLLSKATVALYEDVQEFWVAERTDDGAIVGCGALHVMWEDLAEVRTIAVYEELLRSYDEGVAEFLDLERVKPNTLGNTRMLLHL